MRNDISNKLVHLTKGVGPDASKHRQEAIVTLTNILSQGILLGGTGFIKGSYKCVCFSEAPISALSQILATNTQAGYKYQPYGVLVSKSWLFSKGGRPVIYQPDNDYYLLPEQMRYRHVRFWLSDQYNVDHTWEREWRIQTNSLPITPADVTVVVPNRDAKEAFCDSGYGKWHYIALSDLGVPINSV
jgi:hypothetical protein